MSESNDYKVAMRPTKARKGPLIDLATLTASPVNGFTVLLLVLAVAILVPDPAVADAPVTPAFEEDPVVIG